MIVYNNVPSSLLITYNPYFEHCNNECIYSIQLIFYLNGESQPRRFNTLVDNDCMEVTAAIVSQLRNVLPSAPKEYVCPSVRLSLY